MLYALFVLLMDLDCVLTEERYRGDASGDNLWLRCTNKNFHCAANRSENVNVLLPLPMNSTVAASGKDAQYVWLRTCSDKFAAWLLHWAVIVVQRNADLTSMARSKHLPIYKSVVLYRQAIKD
jgi:hypothetical protein